MKPPHLAAAAVLTFSTVAAAIVSQQQRQPQVVIQPVPPQPLPLPMPGSVPLSDVLGTNRAITSFSSFTRMHESTSSLLGDLGTNTTVLAPLNSAIDDLPRKPWENPADYHAFGAEAYDGSGGQDRANQNLRKFVQAHLVAKSPWPKGEKLTTMANRQIWWDEKKADDGTTKRVIMPDGIEVDKVASQVANGEVVSLIRRPAGSFGSTC